MWRNRAWEEAPRAGGSCGGELLSVGGGGNKRCEFRLDFRKNLPLSSSGQVGEPPPPGVKDVLKRSRQMFVCVNSSVPRAREQVRRLRGLQSSFPVIWVHTLACASASARLCACPTVNTRFGSGTKVQLHIAFVALCHLFLVSLGAAKQLLGMRRIIQMKLL